MKNTWNCPPEPDTNTVRYVSEDESEWLDLQHGEDGDWHADDDPTLVGAWREIVASAAIAGGSLVWDAPEDGHAQREDNIA